MNDIQKYQTSIGEGELGSVEVNDNVLELQEPYINPKVLILDEATSALDYETKELLWMQ